jgi:uncharacterized protein (TIGR02186 family)
LIARLILLAGLLTGLAAEAQSPLVSDISSRRIGIDSSFTGTELLLFGSLDQPGDVVIVIKGPPQSLTVRRKERIAGVWVNADAVTYRNVPGFYAVVSNRPLTDIASERVLRRHGIGIENIRVESIEGGATEAGFDAAVKRLRQQNNLFHQDTSGVTILFDRLYRSTIAFPANVPVGSYTTEVYLFQDGSVVSAQTSPILIDKSGIERALFSFAHQWPLFYGLFAVVIAAFAGWGAAQIFRKS